LHEWIVFITSIIIAIVTSHICSLLEAAILSLSPSQLATLRQNNPRNGRLVAAMKRDINKPVAAILILNTAANTIGATIAGASLNQIFHGKYMGIFSILFTLVIVQYSEILPKTLGCRFNITIMNTAAIPLHIMAIILSPLIKLSHLLNRPFERKQVKHTSTTEEISALAAMARSTEAISSRQERIISMVPKLSEKTALKVMVEAESISFFDSDTTVQEAINSSGKDYHTRYPVCADNDINKVLGYVNFKELVVTDLNHPGSMKITEVMRPIDFVDPDNTAAELMDSFASQHSHMMIVRDPATGQTLGLVTLEDIIEELLGDLDDEFDALPRTFYSPSESLWVVGGGVSMIQIVRDTHLDIPGRAEPVGFWLARELDAQLNRGPKSGDMIRVKNAEFYVRKVRRNQVWELNLKRAKQD
jgi:CBS domain containing-hemolysin-like protein